MLTEHYIKEQRDKLKMLGFRAWSYKDYLNHVCTHDEYYGQFVTEEMIDVVVARIGRDKIVLSTDEHMNDISLRLWDNLNADMLKHTYYWRAIKLLDNSVATGVCLAKVAARRVKYQIIVTSPAFED